MQRLEQKLGTRIAARRRSAQLTQAALAERIDVTTETISRIERGRTVPSLSSLDRIARALGCELHEFLRDDAERDADRVALDRLVALFAKREPDDVQLVADIAQRIFQRFARPGRAVRRARR